jgi:uncharacterized protein
MRCFARMAAACRGYGTLPPMTKALVPRALLDPVVAYFKPQRVILFGSRARGDFHRGSDIDLLVVVDDDTPPERLRPKLETCRRRDADVIPIRAGEFERYRNVVGTLAAEAEADGIVVYGPPKGPPMRNVDPRARWEAVQSWARQAQSDRRLAEAALALDPPELGGMAFHCQQAVEKLLKGFLALAAKRVRKTHSLTELGPIAVASFPEIADLVARAEGWSDWAFVYRYPGDNVPPEPDTAELRAALAVIDALATLLRAVNPEPTD